MTHIIPPILALAAVISWNLMERRSIQSLEAETRDLREAIKVARGSADPATPAIMSKPKSKGPADSRGAPDWSVFAQRLAAMQDGGSPADLKAMLEFQNRLSAMTSAEIAAALDEIQSLGLGNEQRVMMEEMLIDPLIEKDPELALTRFADRIGKDDDGIGWQLSSAMAAWAKKDVAAATAWFDRQIAAGVFDSKSLDGRSQARLEFEAALVANLLDSDIAAAGKRLEALPEDQRREALEQISFSEISSTARANYAGLVRGLVPEDERAGSFANVMSELISEGGYAEVDGFLNGIRATPEERQVSAREAANARLQEIASDRAVTRQDVDAMREWVEKQSPGSADRITGEAIAEATQDGGGFDFDEASRLALEYHRKSATDDVLAEFLESFAARSNLEQALPLADQIRDPKRREEILEMLK